MTYTVDVSYRNFETITEMEEWCIENLYHGGYYEPRWQYYNNHFVFEDEKEYMWFKLRWL